MTLLLATISGCRTVPKSETVTLPPFPERQEIAEPKTVKDMSNILNYYEHLVEEWELWGETVSNLVENP